MRFTSPTGRVAERSEAGLKGYGPSEALGKKWPPHPAHLRVPTSPQRRRRFAPSQKQKLFRRLTLAGLDQFPDGEGDVSGSSRELHTKRRQRIIATAFAMHPPAAMMPPRLAPLAPSGLMGDG